MPNIEELTGQMKEQVSNMELYSKEIKKHIKTMARIYAEKGIRIQDISELKVWLGEISRISENMVSIDYKEACAKHELRKDVIDTIQKAFAHMGNHNSNNLSQKKEAVFEIMIRKWCEEILSINNNIMAFISTEFEAKNTNLTAIDANRFFIGLMDRFKHLDSAIDNLYKMEIKVEDINKHAEKIAERISELCEELEIR